MPESSIHTNLVRLLAEWLIDLLPSEVSSHMLIDIPENTLQKKPPKIYEFVPDIFVPNTRGYSHIIGEAKTATDIDNNHTVEQITAFLRKCSESDNSLLVLAVPWHKVGNYGRQRGVHQALFASVDTGSAPCHPLAGCAYHQ